ncbi:unnamed protein product [Cylicostephanus goldi]|uniref:ShKT domain-containing protein n=1 Tax=Cylicostephanus goldi TaxID=71465 RepID=A0A3P6QA99_CYLGO|nr:unnamed protein product [Cylicostephanus goldi]
MATTECDIFSYRKSLCTLDSSAFRARTFVHSILTLTSPSPSDFPTSSKSVDGANIQEMTDEKNLVEWTPRIDNQEDISADILGIETTTVNLTEIESRRTLEELKPNQFNETKCTLLLTTNFRSLGIITSQINCTDSLKGCLPHLCGKRGYTEFTTSKCAKTCARCHDSSGLVQCQDRRSDCKEWVVEGFCESTLYSTRQKLKFCGKSCQLC